MLKLAGFTGLPAHITKILFIAIIDSLLVSMFFTAMTKSQSQIAAIIALVFLGLNLVYFSRRAVPLKFLFPGIVLLVVFVIVPVFYTILMSGFTYKTGNEISKRDAITQIVETGLQPDAQNTTYDMVLGKVGGELGALVTNQTTTDVGLATKKEVIKLAQDQFSRDQYGVARSAQGFTPLTGDEVSAADSTIGDLKFPLGDGSFIAPQGVDVAIRMTQAYVYDKSHDSIKNIQTGALYKDNHRGNYANTTNAEDLLVPGWRAYNAFENYVSLFADKKIRGPFIGVFIWTICFALITVIMMFAAGLLLAIAMDKKIALRRFYRSILILPYAIPSFMSILIWNGMFNRQYGAVNLIIGQNIDWYNSPWLARGVILIVNLWLGFPYFYLISSGALQAIPSELEEAAAIDGASPRQILRQIKLPILLQILSPLLIASFAFNFNNFNLIYLLTGGGPTDVLHGEVAGATDILITYTYKTAFGSNEQNLGLACAISMVMFIIVGSLSMWSLRRSKVLDAL